MELIENERRSKKERQREQSGERISTRQKDRTIIGSEVMEWIQTGKQTNTRAKVGQLHNVLY